MLPDVLRLPSRIRLLKDSSLQLVVFRKKLRDNLATVVEAIEKLDLVDPRRQHHAFEKSLVLSGNVLNAAN
jgi:hypothetical protein